MTDYQALEEAERRPDLSLLAPRRPGDLPELPPLLPAVPELPPDLLPESIRPWLTDIADRAQVASAAVAAPAIVALGSVIGRQVGIRPKARDDWLVIPNLWGAVVDRPGSNKSYAISQAIAPLRHLANSAREEHRLTQTEADAEVDVIRARIESVKTALKKPNADIPALQADLVDLHQQFAQAEHQGHERRYIVNDTTVEKVGELLNRNPNGLLLVRDELSGFLASLRKSGREGDREFYLESWNGLGSYTYDRIGRGTLHIDALTLSIIGGIQPGKLRHYLAGALKGGGEDDGLLQRLQVLVWPDRPGPWRNIDREPNVRAQRCAAAIFGALENLSTADLGALGDGGVPYLRFAPDAQSLFDEFRTTLERRVRALKMEATPAFESHLAKYRSLMPSLALIFHLVAVVDGQRTAGPVSLDAAKLAAAWCDFLEAHACKVYAPELNAELASAHALREKIKVGVIGDGALIRDIYRHNWSGLSTPDAVEAGLQVLQEHGIIQLATVRTDGRSSHAIRLSQTGAA